MPVTLPQMLQGATPQELATLLSQARGDVLTAAQAERMRRGRDGVSAPEAPQARYAPMPGETPMSALPVREVGPAPVAMPLQSARGPMGYARSGNEMVLPQQAAQGAQEARLPSQPSMGMGGDGGLLELPYRPRGGLLGAPEETQEAGGMMGGGFNPLTALGLALSGIGDIASGGETNALGGALQSLQAMREMRLREQLLQAKLADQGDYLKTINNQLVDTRTGEVVGDYRDPPEDETEMFTVKQGDTEFTVIGDKTDPTTWRNVAEAPRYKPGSTNVSVSTGGPVNPFAKADEKTVETMMETVRSGRELLPNLEQIKTALDAGVETGRIEEMSLPIRQIAADLGWEDEGLPAQEALAAAAAYMIPRMRVSGSGASSDRDMGMFERAVPNMKNTPTGNRLIVGATEQIIRRRQRELDLMRQYYDQNGSMTGAWDYVDEQLGPLFPKPQSAEEYGAIPPGTVYIHPDRGFSVKRGQ